MSASTSTVHVEVRSGAYQDSVTLMQVSRRLAGLPGVSAAQVAMGTPLNLDLMAAAGLPAPAGTGPNDLVVALRVRDEQARDEALAELADALAAPAATGGPVGGDPEPRTTGSALRRAPAGLVVVSVPGGSAFVEAMDAVRSGSSVVVFSDNVPVEQEVALKDEAARRDVLVMGPDCGTAVVAGAGVGFANAVTPGPVSLVAASGTGAQQLMALLDAAGVGVRHCLGLGGRDLSAAVGGRSASQALRALAADEGTELVVLVSKPPDPAVAQRLRAEASGLGLDVVWALLGPDQPDLTEAAEAALTRLGVLPPTWPTWSPPSPGPPPSAAGLRGLFVGGTLCDEAMVIAAAGLGPVRSNIPLRPEWSLDVDGAGDWDLGDPNLGDREPGDREPGDRDRGDRDRGDREPGDQIPGAAHAMVDFGDDRLTVGRPHPMIDPTPRELILRRQAEDERVGVLLLDVVLGHGAHPDPAGTLAPAVEAARAAGAARALAVVVSITGTRGDTQGLRRQALALAAAGAHVHLSNAGAARHAVALLTPAGGPR